MNDIVDRLRGWDVMTLNPDGVALFGIQFAHAGVLLLLLLLPLWGWWRRRRVRLQPAILFSRAGVLAAGPHPPIAWTRILPWLRSKSQEPAKSRLR